MKRLLWFLALLLGYAALRVALAAGTARQVPEFWKTQAARPVPQGAFRLVMLGDSSAQAIGAAHPLDGVAGRVARHVQTITGKPVHVVNLAEGGATVGAILRDQLPRADLNGADLVLVSTANDLEQRVPLDTYEKNLKRLLTQLPHERTVYSDFPVEPGRPPYQAILTRQADAHRIRRADFAGVFSEARHLLIFSWLPPHLNSRGYALWFKAFRPAVDDILANRR